MTRHVPISEFKDHASELVASVQNGEEIIITRHGKAAARVSAITGSEWDLRERVRGALDKLAQLREAQRARGVTTSIDEIIAWKNEGQR